mmetsp:Transcript_44960/g.126938  ORF Transcript_44960/g.126938 Transcript_44960/m.126938 type:complete len:263 (-) Transcript_44960:668-1456(-)
MLVRQHLPDGPGVVLGDVLWVQHTTAPTLSQEPLCLSQAPLIHQPAEDTDGVLVLVLISLQRLQRRAQLVAALGLEHELLDLALPPHGDAPVDDPPPVLECRHVWVPLEDDGLADEDHLRGAGLGRILLDSIRHNPHHPIPHIASGHPEAPAAELADAAVPLLPLSGILVARPIEHRPSEGLLHLPVDECGVDRGCGGCERGVPGRRDGRGRRSALCKADEARCVSRIRKRPATASRAELGVWGLRWWRWRCCITPRALTLV